MNIILNSDSYKYSQFMQYPEGTEYVYSYIESRGGAFTDVMFFGLQMYIEQYLSKPITQEDIDEAEELITMHGLPFNREGWEYILNEHGGKLPIIIKAVPEGTILAPSNVLVTIQNTDPKCFWLTSFLETSLLRAVWYPTTVASNSYASRKIIMRALEVSGTPEDILFKLHDFGFRGVSSTESAGIGGLAHLINFRGTDTIEALVYARKFYGEDMAGFSIAAMEHSTVTSWGRDGEEASFRNMLQCNPNSVVACVSDSYDIYAACELWGTKLKEDVLNHGANVVIRPDSGDPATVVRGCLRILDSHFGHTINEKGYKVLNNVRVIQGDGITHNTIKEILQEVMLDGFSADNVTFGQGGALLQSVDRDTLKFAMKCSAIQINGQWQDVFKDPITDLGKRSKRGRLMLVDGKTVGIDELGVDQMKVVYCNGSKFGWHTLDEVRENAGTL